MAITLVAAAIKAAIDAAANAVAALADAGSGAGRIRLKLANDTVVATCVGQDPFFNAAASNGAGDGQCPQNGTAVDANATGNAGTVTKFDLADSDGTAVLSGTVAESGADLNIDDGTADANVVIQAGAVVTLSNIILAFSMA